jgi:WD40 repeat protein
MEGAFEDAGFGFEEDDVAVANTQALSLSWAFGFSKDVKRAVIDLSNETRRAAFYLSAHTGVIYDYTGMQREQHHLQGHCNPITSACHDLERRFIATGDAGPADTLVVVWDAVTATPIKSIFDPHAYGVAGMDMSPDGQFLATLSAPPPPGSPAAATWVQEIAVWEWHEDTERPRCTATVNLPAGGAADLLTCIRFNPTDVRQLITHSNSRVTFWQWHVATDGRAGSLASFSPPVNPRDFGQTLGAFTDVAFLPPRDAFMASSNGVDGSYDMSRGAVALSAVSCTKDGDLLLWEASTLGGDDALPQIASWHPTKLLNICKGSVMCLTVVAAGCPQPWLVAGCADGAVRVYDYQFRVISWFEKIDFSAITSLSFAMPTPQVRRAKIAAAAANTSFVEKSDGAYDSPAFVVGTSAAVIVALSAADATKSPAGGAATIGTVLAQGMATAPTSIVGHPTEPFLAIGTQGGNVHLWNLDQRRLVNLRRLARDEELELKDATEASKSATRDFRSASAGEAKAKARAKASKAKKRVARARTAMQQLEVTCCAYNAPGTLLAVGTANGRLLLLHSGTLEELGSHDVSAESAITHIRFSSDGIFLATADTDRCVAVYRYKRGGGAEDARGGGGDFDPQAGWVFVGKNRSHTESIADLQFSYSESELDAEGRECVDRSMNGCMNARPCLLSPTGASVLTLPPSLPPSLTA